MSWASLAPDCFRRHFRPANWATLSSSIVEAGDVADFGEDAGGEDRAEAGDRVEGLRDVGHHLGDGGSRVCLSWRCRVAIRLRLHAAPGLTAGLQVGRQRVGRPGRRPASAWAVACGSLSSPWRAFAGRPPGPSTGRAEICSTFGELGRCTARLAGAEDVGEGLAGLVFAGFEV